MSVLFLVVPIALVLVAAAIGAFVWAARRGEFDDLTTPAVRMLEDEDIENRVERMEHSGETK